MELVELFGKQIKIHRNRREAYKEVKNITTEGLLSELKKLVSISGRLKEALYGNTGYDSSVTGVNIKDAAEYLFMLNITIGEIRSVLYERKAYNMSKAESYSPYTGPSPSPVMKLSGHSRRSSVIRGISI